MRYLTATKASTYALLSFSSIVSAWPTYNLHNSQFAKRQGPGDLPSQGGQTEEPVFNEDYDFIVAGGTSTLCSPHEIIGKRIIPVDTVH